MSGIPIGIRCSLTQLPRYKDICIFAELYIMQYYLSRYSVTSIAKNIFYLLLLLPNNKHFIITQQRNHNAKESTIPSTRDDLFLL